MDVNHQKLNKIISVTDVELLQSVDSLPKSSLGEPSSTRQVIPADSTEFLSREAFSFYYSSL
jgi:hypothetical protein